MKIRLLWSVVLCAVAVVASAAPADVGYAPPETNLIVRVNGPRIRRSRAFELVRKSPRFSRIEKDAQRDLEKLGVAFDDLLDTDIFVFVFIDAGGRDKAAQPCFNMVARSGKPLAGTALAWLDTQIEPGDWRTFAKDPVDGKPARVLKDEFTSLAVIALEKDLVQYSMNTRCAALTPRPPVAFAKFMEPEAMLSVACRMDEVADEEFCRRLPPEYAQFSQFVVGLRTAAVNILDDGDRIRIGAELAYSDEERAKMVTSQLNGMVFALMFALSDKDPEKVAVLRKLRIVFREHKVVIAFSCRNEELERAVTE